MKKSDHSNYKPIYLNIIWHQHQPSYLDPESDQLQGPWVRTHGTKDYYDMAAIIEKYPKLHFTINLTPSLIFQLQEYYVKRLKPFVNYQKNRIDAEKYFTKNGGKTDPWIDLALKSTEKFDDNDLNYLLTNVWNAFGVSDVVIARFPQYKKLKDKYFKHGRHSLTVQELREIKFWFYVAEFDPDFLDNPYQLITGTKVDLTDIIQKNPDGTYISRKTIEEDDCNRIIAETYKILSAIIPVHKKLAYNPSTRKGQIEIITTPYYHPILPLIYDSDIAKVCQPNSPLPPRFAFPADAEIQIKKAIELCKKVIGIRPYGLWPAEGSVAHDIIPLLSKEKVKWIATDQKILERSKPEGQPNYYPYVVQADHTSKKDAVVIVFRDTILSDKIGFVYKNYRGEDAAEDFINNVLQYAPKADEPDRLLTVILDGENAWEWYVYDNDGKIFQNELYKRLSKLYETGDVITTTVSEYITGNPQRNIPPHPVETLPKLDWLYPGSWINSNFDTWIGDEEENKAWEYLLTARKDLEASGISQPIKNVPPKKKTKAWYAYKAWESIYAAEGSDWFWWYGTDQNAPAGDKPFDVAFLTHIKNVYRFAELAGASMPERKFEPIINISQDEIGNISGSVMAQSQEDTMTVLFQCDARDIYVRKSIYIAGNIMELGNWVPNKIKLYDDGTHGDQIAGDHIWSIELKLPIGIEVEYKYTNSGPEGGWYPGEEFPAVNRKIRIEKKSSDKIILFDKFGKI